MAVFILFNTLMALLLVDNNPLTRSATGMVHGRCEAATLLLRALVGLLRPLQPSLPMWLTVCLLVLASGAMTALPLYYLPFFLAGHKPSARRGKRRLLLGLPLPRRRAGDRGRARHGRRDRLSHGPRARADAHQL